MYAITNHMTKNSLCKPPIALKFNSKLPLGFMAVIDLDYIPRDSGRHAANGTHHQAMKNLQAFRDSGIQGFRDSGIQGFRDSIWSACFNLWAWWAE
jgi:hypothetical protein